MNLGKSVVYSVAVHALIIAMLLFIVPAPEKKKAGGEFLTDLVSPEELLPKPRSLSPKPRTRSSAPAPTIREMRNARPEQGAPRDQTSRLPGETIDTKAAPPSPNLSKGGRGGFAGESQPGNEGNVNQKPDSVGPTLKEKLFDKKVIGDLAKRDVEKGEKNRTFTFDAD